MQDIGRLEEQWTDRLFAERYESGVGDDWPRCESCSEPLDDSEMQHSGDLKICNNCGVVCGHCDEKVFNEDAIDGKTYHKDIDKICCECVEEFDPEEIEPYWSTP